MEVTEQILSPLYFFRSLSFSLKGFHLSATVVSPQAGQSKGAYNVAVMFDRCRITSCSCTCGAGAKWCAHVVALCLFRIHNVSLEYRHNMNYTALPHENTYTPLCCNYSTVYM